MKLEDLKVGERYVTNSTRCTAYNGCKGAVSIQITSLTGYSAPHYNILDKYGKILDICNHCIKADTLTPYESSHPTTSSIFNPTSFMSTLVTKWKNFTMSEPEKTFVKVGIQGNDGNLTAEGLSLYNAWRFEKDKEEFAKEVANKLLADQEEKK